MALGDSSHVSSTPVVSVTSCSLPLRCHWCSAAPYQKSNGEVFDVTPWGCALWVPLLHQTIAAPQIHSHPRAKTHHWT